MQTGLAVPYAQQHRLAGQFLQLSAEPVGPSTSTVYVANCTSGNTVSVIKEATDAVTATVPVGNSPVELAVDPVTGNVYVVNNFDNTVSVVALDQQASCGRPNTVLGYNALTYDTPSNGMIICVVGGKITSPIGYKVVARLQQASCGRPNTVLGYNALQYDVSTWLSAN